MQKRKIYKSKFSVNSRKKIYNFIRFLIGLGLIIFLYFKFKPANFTDLFAGKNFFWIVDALLIYFAAILVTSLRLKIMLEKNQIRASFKDIFWSNISGMLFSEITPGKVGYIYAAHSLAKKTKIKFSKNLSVIISTQVLDFALRAVLGVAAVILIIFFKDLDISSKRLIFVGFLIILLMALGLIFISSSSHTLKTFRKLPILRNPMILKGMRVLQGSQKKSLSNFTTIFILTLLSWLLTSSRWIFLGYFFGLAIPWYLILLIQPLIFGLSFIPLTIGGLGLIEGAAVLVLGLLGVEHSLAITFAIIDRLTIYFVETLGLVDFLNIGKRT